MSVTVTTPWGDEPLGAPDQHARVFAFSHFSAGHRYVVSGEPGSYSVDCDCGKRYTAGDSTVLYP